jgi:hypothetical protein
MTGVIYSDDADSDCLAALRFELGNLAVEIVNHAINLPDHCFLYDLYLDPNFNGCKAVKGLPADLMIEICQGFVQALEASLIPGSNHKMTVRQQQIAVKASRFLSACAKVGLEALIDEATGY